MGATSVLILPGFAGSALWLHREGGLSDLVEWISPTRLAVNGLDWLQLDALGLNPGPLAHGGPLFAFGPSVPAYYQPLVNQLLADGYAPEARYYDWRLSARLYSGPLQQRMAALDAAGPWACIAHSFGAVQSLLAWAGLAAAGLGKNCKRFLWVDAALGGSYGAVYCLAGGNFDELSWGWPVAVLQGGLAIISRPNHFLYPLSQRLDASVASWPALYELMPSTQGPFGALDARVGAVYDQRNWLVNPYVQQQWCDWALGTQAAVAKALAGPLPPSVVVRSGRRTTLSQLPLSTLHWDTRYRYGADYRGDGTLLDERSGLPGVSVYQVGGDHAAACGDPIFLENAADLIEGGLTVDENPQPLPVPAPSLKPEVGPRPTPPPLWPTIQVRGDP